jgi:hypothetical protein
MQKMHDSQSPGRRVANPGPAIDPAFLRELSERSLRWYVQQGGHAAAAASGELRLRATVREMERQEWERAYYEDAQNCPRCGFLAENYRDTGICKECYKADM